MDKVQNSTSIAVLMTCYNRREKTISCLKALFESILAPNYIFEVFLVDDGSVDGTEEAVKKGFPKVNLIKGNGNLFWNRGMRLAWQGAIEKQEYDFYFWLNDDTILFKNAIRELLDSGKETYEIEKRPGIIVGACQDSNDTNQFSYGGRVENGPVIPNGKIQECKYINGNAVLVPKAIYEKLGILSSIYTHTMGDIDYGLRAQQMNFKCYSTRTFIATCPVHDVKPDWCNPNVSLKKRFKHLYSPKGLNMKEYNKFRKKFWGSKWILFSIKAYLKTISPSLYNKLSNN